MYIGCQNLRCDIRFDDGKANAPIVAFNKGPRPDRWFRGLLIFE